MILNSNLRQEDDPHVVNLLAGFIDGTESYSAQRSQGSRSWLLIHTVSGSGFASVLDQSVKCEAGSITLLPPRIAHSYGTQVDPVTGRGSWNINWAHFHPRLHWEDLLRWPTSDKPIQTLDQGGSRMGQLFAEVIELSSRGDRLSERLAMLRIEEILLLCSSSAKTDGPEIDPRIKKAVEFLHAEYTSPIGIGEMAAVAGLSVSRFSHRFSEEVGVPPREYLERLRIRRSKHLLAISGTTVREIASLVGFSNEFYFSRRFKDVLGISPSEYRRQA